MKRQWTRAEKWLWATPLIFVIAAGVAAFGPQVARKQLGYPQILKLHAGDRVSSLVLSRDGSTLAASLDQPARSNRPEPAQVNFWDARTLKPLAPLGTRPLMGNGRTFNYVMALSPDGKSVVVAPLTNQNLTLYDKATQRARWKINGFFQYSMAIFAPNGKTLVVSRDVKQGCQVLLLRVRDGQILTQWHSRISCEQMRFSWAPDGKTLACSGAVPASITKENSAGIASYQIEIHRATDGKILRFWNERPLQSLNFSPDGRSLVAVTYQLYPVGATWNYQVAFLDATTGQQQWHFQSKADANIASFVFCEAKVSPDGKRIAAISIGSGKDGGKVLLLDAQTGALERTLNWDEITGSDWLCPDSLAFSPDGKRLYARGKNAVLVWDLD